MVSSKEICPEHKKPIIYAFDNKKYCKDCLDNNSKIIKEMKKEISSK